MPFEDEVLANEVVVVVYRASWASEAAALSRELRAVLPGALGIEHIGSTSIPGMAAKDCLDLMIVVDDLERSKTEPALAQLGYRRRPEVWNNLEAAAGRDWPKMTFAPPIGARPVNLHVREAGSPTVRLALLFREHLRANPDRTAWWSELKREAAAATGDLAAYGRIKYPAWRLLMELAEVWADDRRWLPPDYGHANPRIEDAPG